MVYKKIACFALFLGVTAALAAEPPDSSPETIKARSTIANSVPVPAISTVSLPSLSAEELPASWRIAGSESTPILSPRPMASQELPELPPPRPISPLFKLAPVTPSHEVDALRSELLKLRQRNEERIKERRSVDPSEVHRPKVEGEAGDGETSLQLRVRLAEKLALLRKFRDMPKAAPPTPAPVVETTPVPKHVTPPIPKRGSPSPEINPDRETINESPIDAPGLGRVLFLSGAYAKALETYRSIDPSEQLPEDRLTTQYMMACCLRKLGKLDESAALYRDVGNSGGHESLVTNAQWHLQTMKGHQELVAELDRLRSLRETLTRRLE